MSDGEASLVTFVASLADELGIGALKTLKGVGGVETRKLETQEKPGNAEVLLFTMPPMLSELGDVSRLFSNTSTRFKLAAHHFFYPEVQLVIPKEAVNHPFVIGLPIILNGNLQTCIGNFALQYMKWFNSGCIGVPWAPSELRSSINDPALHKWLTLAQEKLEATGIWLDENALVKLPSEEKPKIFRI